MKTTNLIFSAFALVAMATGLHAQEGTLTDETYNASPGGISYGNASSIPVSSTDLIEGLAPINTNYVGDYEATGGTLGVLTDGTTGVGKNAATSSSNAAFDLGSSSWYAEYKLPTTTLGYTLSSVVVTTGHADNRVDQGYDILVSTDGLSFYSLSNGSTQTLGSAGGEFSYGPSLGAGGAAQSTVSPVGANLGTGIRYVEFVAEDNGADVYRELDVNGRPTSIPEPSSWAMLLAGGLSLLVWRHRASRA